MVLVLSLSCYGGISAIAQARDKQLLLAVASHLHLSNRKSRNGTIFVVREIICMLLQCSNIAFWKQSFLFNLKPIAQVIQVLRGSHEF